jgi:hypothetical protein
VQGTVGGQIAEALSDASVKAPPADLAAHRSRRMAVVTGFYRICVIDAVLEHSPADYVHICPH